MKIVFFGSSEFSIPVLQALISKHEVVQVITTPDQKKGRGQILASTVVKEFAEKNKIPVSDPPKLSNPDIINSIQNIKPDLIVIASYGKLVPEAIFKTAQLAPLNVHPSLLPKHRGASPIQRAILEGDPKTGVSIAEITKDLDAGDLFAQVETEIHPNENAQTLSARLAQTAADLILKVIQQLESKTIQKIQQDHGRFTYAKKIEKEEGKIDWTKPPQAIHNQVRAYYPWPGAYTFFQSKRLKILETEISGSGKSNQKPGIVLEIKPDFILVQAGDGTLCVKRVQLEGKREISAYDFSLGQHLKPGDLFQ